MKCNNHSDCNHKVMIIINACIWNEDDPREKAKHRGKPIIIILKWLVRPRLIACDLVSCTSLALSVFHGHFFPFFSSIPRTNYILCLHKNYIIMIYTINVRSYIYTRKLCYKHLLGNSHFLLLNLSQNKTNDSIVNQKCLNKKYTRKR